MGKAKIKLPNGNRRMLKEVRHILDLKMNLISVSNLYGGGYMVEFDNKTWNMSKGYTIIARGNMVDTLYLRTNTSNDVSPTCGNVFMDNHKFRKVKRNEVRFGEKKKVEKVVSKDKKNNMWIPEVQGGLKHQYLKSPPRGIRRYKRVNHYFLVVSCVLYIDGG